MQEIQNRRSITIRKGYEYRSFVNNIYDDREFFYPAYCKAAQCINEIIESSQRFLKRHSDPDGRDLRSQSAMPALSYEQELLSYPNNVIAFCAKRGQGKTSAMVSMAKALEQMGSDNQQWDRERIGRFWNSGRQGVGEKYRADECRYCVVDPIDPTTMEQNDSVMRNVLSRLFTQFCKTWEIREEKHSWALDSGHSEEKKDKLLEAFTKCYQSLDELKLQASPERYDDLRRLSEVGDSVRMKRDFVALVQAFLDYERKDMLVIQIDDADLNTARTYELMEDIRRYCVVPRVIILMAIHLGTLRSCIEQQNVRNYEYLLRGDLKIEHLAPTQCREMAERYIDKLLPGRHQIHLPYVENAVLNLSFEPNIYYLDDEGNDLLSFDTDPGRVEGQEPQQDMFTYEKRLFRLIYEKTGVILMSNTGFLHNFMPKRFRELTHFLSFFVRLEGIDPSNQGSLNKLLELAYRGTLSEQERLERERLLSQRLQNLDELETYFIQHWCPVNLTQGQVEQIKEIMQAPHSVKHAKAMECIHRYTTDGNPEISGKITYAEVVDALNKLKQRYNKYYEFIYAIQLYYTIYMNKLVCTRIKQRRDFRDLSSFFHYTLFPGHLYESNEVMSGRFLLQISLLEQARVANARDLSFEDYSWLCYLVLLKGADQPFDFNILSYDENTPASSLGDARFDLFDGLFFLLDRFQMDMMRNLRKATDVQAFCQQLASVLQLICNYDSQYRIRKYCLKGCLNRQNGIRDYNYSNWAADLLLTIDLLIQGQEQTVQEPAKLQKYQTLAATYDIPSQYLPLMSNLNELLNDKATNALVRNALDIIYLCQDNRHREQVLHFVDTVIERLGKAIDSIEAGDTVMTNQANSDWWTTTKRTLLDYLKSSLEPDGTVLYRSVFFTNDEHDFEVELDKTYSILKDFDEGVATYTPSEMKETLQNCLKNLEAVRTGGCKLSGRRIIRPET